MDTASIDPGVPSQLEHLCDEFESRFRLGQSPCIADFLQRVEAQQRSQLLLKLVVSEIRLLGDDGTKSSAEQLLQRYECLVSTGAEREALRATIESVIAATTNTNEVDLAATTTFHAPSRPHSTAAVLPPIEGFEIESVLGRGGMGVVYKAVQTSLHRTVALKMILDGAAASPEDLERFEREAQAVAELNDPHFVQIYEFGKVGGKPYMALEFVEGGSLEKYREGSPQPVEFAARTVEVLARAMHKAHTIGLLHRDLKPHNVLLAGDGTPKIGDFGLVKRLDPDESLMTRQGTIVGTASYMAPEQTHSGTILGPTADVYALGGILYCLLTGRPPFLGATVYDTILAVRDTDPVPPSRLRPNTPRDLEVICLACLEKDPLKRYATAADLADDLRRYLEGRPITRRPVSALERAWRWSKRNPLRAAVAGLVVAIAVVSSVMSWRLMVANDLLRITTENEKAERRKAEVAEQAKSEQYNSALETFHDVLMSANQLLRNNRQEAEVLKQINGITMQGLENMRDPSDPNTLYDRNLAIHHQSLGDLFFTTGQVKNAEKLYSLEHQAIETALRQEPAEPLHRRNLAAACDKWGAALERLGDTLRARRKYEESLESRKLWDQKLLAQNTNHLPAKKAIASSHLDLARINLLLGDARAALEHLQQAEQWYRQAPAEDVAAEMVAVNHRLGDAHCQLGNLDEAQRLLTQVQADCAKQQKDRPSEQNGRALAAARLRLGDFYLTARRDVPNAWGRYKLALAGYAKLFEQDNSSALSRANLASIEYRIGVLLFRAQETEVTLEGVPDGNDPQTHFQRSCALREELAKIDLGDMQAKIEWALALARCGRAKEAEEQAELLVQKGQGNPRLLTQAAATFALCSGTAATDELRARCRQRAYEVLGQLIRSGWQDRAVLRDDPDLDPIRSEPRYQQLLESLPTPAASATNDLKNNPA